MKRIFSILALILIFTNVSVSYAEDTAYSFNDPWFEQQWYYEAIHAQAYRDNGIDGTDVKVGVLDSGFDPGLDDFNYDNISMINICAAFDGDIDNISNTFDSHSHGVPVTSMIAAQANNNAGIVGLTENVYVNAYQLDDRNYSSAANSAALHYGLYNAYMDGCDVINISKGSDYGTSSHYVDFDKKMIDYAKQDGMIIVAAVGNNGDKEQTLNHYSFPALMDDVIAVGGVEPTCDTEHIYYNEYTGIIGDKADIDIKQRSGTSTWLVSTILNNPDTSYKRCSFSTANDSIFVSAPGDNGIGDAAASWLEKKLWDTLTGTSFAAPIVTSAAIGVKQMRPYVDTDMFKEILKATSVDLDEPGYDINTGWGMVDFQAIYDYVSQMPETIPMATPEIEIDYENGVLKGFQGKYNYENYKLQEQVLGKYDYYINGEKITPNYPQIASDTPWNKLLDTPTGEVPIDESWYGKDISITVKSKGKGFTGSEPQTLSIPAVPDAPDLKYNIIFDDEGSVSSVDGITEEMEFRKVGTNEWGTGAITSAGEYEIRYKATENSFPSITYVVTFEDKEPEIPVVHKYDIETSVSYENGEVSYSYTNYTENDIPAVGVVAVYDTNNSFIGMHTIDGFKTGTNNGSFSVEGDIGSVKFFAWEDFLGLKPYEKCNVTEYVL